MFVAEADQFQQVPGNRSGEGFLHFAPTVVVPIDVPTHRYLRQEIHIIAARQQTDVIDLGNARRKELNGTRNQIVTIISAQSIIIGAVDLIQIKVRRRVPGRAPAQTTTFLVNCFNQAV